VVNKSTMAMGFGAVFLWWGPTETANGGKRKKEGFRLSAAVQVPRKCISHVHFKNVENIIYFMLRKSIIHVNEIKNKINS
jgi:hypothetical protein